MTILRAGSKAPFAMVTKNADQTIATSTSTALTWETQSEDEYSMWSSGSNTRLTTPSWAKVVQVGANIGWTSVGGSSFRRTWTDKNAADFTGRGSYYLNATQTTAWTAMYWSAPVVVVGGTDYFRIVARQVTGSNRFIEDANSWFSVIVQGTT